MSELVWKISRGDKINYDSYWGGDVIEFFKLLQFHEAEILRNSDTNGESPT